MEFGMNSHSPDLTPYRSKLVASHKGIYTCEEMHDFSWASIGIGIIFIYHFIPLQIIASLSGVNLNNILCPAVSDPFSGPMYRIFAIMHQAISLPLLGKLLNWIGLQISLDRQKQSCQAVKDQNKMLESSKCASTLDLHNNIPVSPLLENPANETVNNGGVTVLRHTALIKKDKNEICVEPNSIPCPDMFRQNYALPGSIITDDHLSHEDITNEHYKQQ